jgi:hypothetical protein
MPRRPAKPRITKPHLTWKWNRRREVWEPYFRITWTEGGRQRERAVKLDWQNDPERLDFLYWECRTGRHEKQRQPAQYTWGEAITAWRGDPRIQGKIAAGTKKSYRSSLELILATNAEKDMRRTTRAGMRAAHEALSSTPRKADKLLAVSSLIWNYAATELDWPIGENPAAKIRKFGRQTEFAAWPAWMIEALPDAPAVVRIAAELILGTGQRPGAAIAMRRDAFRGEWMTLVDEKNAEEFEIFIPDRLRAFLDETPNRGAYVIAKNLTEPLGYDAVYRQFADWRATLGPRAEGFRLHGLRKSAIIELAEAGCSDAQIHAITNQTLEMVQYYRRRANRKKLSKAAAKMRGQNENGS